MSKLSKAASQMREEKILRKDETVTNFMGGDSYIINPLDTLKMISASSIMGEPSYYRTSKLTNKFKYAIDYKLKDEEILFKSYTGKTTEECLVEAIDRALDYDYEEVLKWAVELRNDYFMRLNPQVIMVRAAMHPNRTEFTKNNPGKFDEYNKKVMQRADEPLSQMAYYMWENKSKNNMPSILKRSWAKKISNLTPYQLAKYKNHEIGMIDGVRLCHAHSPIITELLRTGTYVVDDTKMTWENYISKNGSTKESWEYVIDNIFNSPKAHMAILRNLRNMAEMVDTEHMKKVLATLKEGVLEGKQFPFRYYSAINNISSNSPYIHMIAKTLEECMDISLDNMPKLKGRTMCLSDNSGSAWGSFTSSYGKVSIADIDNLSSTITACNSEEGYVGKFGDKLEVIPMFKRRGVLNQATELSKDGGLSVGHSTENGIWLFFKKAIDNKEHWDNIFIYSDMQAGHGGLYGLENADYFERGYSYSKTKGYTNYINVYKLINDYRKLVNPKVNVFCIQTAGYNNALIPEYAYRTNIMYGWTGKELHFADTMIKLWDSIERKKDE